MGYDPEQRVMEIAFQNGSVYRYVDVLPQQHQSLIEAESKGKVFRTLMNDGVRGVRIDVGKEAVAVKSINPPPSLPGL